MKLGELWVSFLKVKKYSEKYKEITQRCSVKKVFLEISQNLQVFSGTCVFL